MNDEKLVSLNNLDKLSKSLNAHYKEMIQEESDKAMAEIEATKSMLDGKSIKYVTQAEYDNLSEAEKNNDTVVYFITDAVDTFHEHENKEFLDNLAARNIAIGNKSQLFDGINDLVYTIEDIGASPAVHNHDDMYYTETEIDGKIEDINEVINEQVAEITASLEVLNGAKLNTSDATDIFIQSILSQEGEGESYDIHILVKGEKIISPIVSVNTIIDDNSNPLTDYLSYFDTSITNLSSAIGNANELLTDAKDSVVSCINELQTEINNLDNELDTKIKVVDALTLNGYSIWVGTTEELEAITERDPKTLYFEISDETSNDDDVVQVNVSNGVLQLTTDKYQKTTMITGTEIVFPTVNKFTEIHLYFDAETDMDLSFPDCRWRVDPNIEAGKSYEIVATYNTIQWLVNVIVYS